MLFFKRAEVNLRSFAIDVRILAQLMWLDRGATSTAFGAEAYRAAELFAYFIWELQAEGTADFREEIINHIRRIHERHYSFIFPGTLELHDQLGLLVHVILIHRAKINQLLPNQIVLHVPSRLVVSSLVRIIAHHESPQNLLILNALLDLFILLVLGNCRVHLGNLYFLIIARLFLIFANLVQSVLVWRLLNR